MGTSSARRGPTTRLWRAAKGAATRYLAPEAAGAVTAAEVVARYLAALGENSGPGDEGGLAAFRLTRRVAQDLGAWAAAGHSQGWNAALELVGLAALRDQPREVAWPAICAALTGAGGGLEEAVARTALAPVRQDDPLSPGVPSLSSTEPAQLVPQFLAAALHLRLALDLGDSLEAAAGSWSRHRQGLAGLKDRIVRILAASLPLDPAPQTSEQWRGLAGWTWVTRVLAALMQRLREKEASGGAP